MEKRIMIIGLFFQTYTLVLPLVVQKTSGSGKTGPNHHSALDFFEVIFCVTVYHTMIFRHLLLSHLWKKWLANSGNPKQDSISSTRYSCL